MVKKKIFINQNILYGFRVPIFNELSVKFCISVFSASYEKKISQRFCFDFFKVPSIGRELILQFFWPSKIKDYDVYILIFDLRILTNLLVHILAKLRGRPVIYWGIGYGKSKLGNRLRDMILKFADGLIVYSPSAEISFRSKHPNLLITTCNNTVTEIESDIPIKTEINSHLIFVGALEARKDLGSVIEALAKCRSTFYTLTIVGDGPNRAALEAQVSRLGLNGQVFFEGHIDDPFELQKLFSRASFSISLGQAGLSVLLSLMYSTPFLTNVDCITGGEVDALSDGENGFLFGPGMNFRSFDDFILALSNGDMEIRYSVLSQNARSTYLNHYSSRNMVNKIARTINDACV